MIVFREDDDFVASGDSAGESHRCLNGFRSGVYKAGPLISRDFAEELRRLHGIDALGTDLDSAIQLGMESFRDKIGRMPQKIRAESIEKIDVFIPVHIEKA